MKSVVTPGDFGVTGPGKRHSLKCPSHLRPSPGILPCLLLLLPPPFSFFSFAVTFFVGAELKGSVQFHESRVKRERERERRERESRVFSLDPIADDILRT